MYIGRNTDGTLSRALMRFPSLNLTGISADQITNAYVELKDLMCQDDEPMIIECRQYLNTAPSWSEAQTVTWTSVGTNYYGAVLDSHEVLYGQENAPDSGSIHRYRFDLTSLARDWANGTQSAAKRIVLKATDTFEGQTGSNIQYWKKTFASYNRSANKPLFSLEYEPTISIIESEVSVVEFNSVALSVVVPDDCPISWQSIDENVATVDEYGMITGLNAGKAIITATIEQSDNTAVTDSCIVYVRIADGVYIIENYMAEYSLYTNTISINVFLNYKTIEIFVNL